MRTWGVDAWANVLRRRRSRESSELRQRRDQRLFRHVVDQHNFDNAAATPIRPRDVARRTRLDDLKIGTTPDGAIRIRESLIQIRDSIGDALDLTALRAQLDARLARYARPLFLRISHRLETTDTFKEKKARPRGTRFRSAQYRGADLCRAPRSAHI